MSSYVPSYKNIIPQNTISTISKRYKEITRAINKEFWECESVDQHSIYVGSYGRRTAINTSDLDILIELPEEDFIRFDNYSSNGQSRLLQSIKTAIQAHYPRSDVRADGQVVKINFYDGIKFEILPAFKQIDNTYLYPDTNMGGNWLSTNPKAEQNAIKLKNNLTNRLLSDTCRHIRFVRDNYFKSYHLSGIVIDSFVYQAMDGWYRPVSFSHTPPPPGSYEKSLYNFCMTISSNGQSPFILFAPGSNDLVETESSYECLIKVLKYIAF